MVELPNEIWIAIILQLDLPDLAGWRCATCQFHAMYVDEYHWQCRLKQLGESDLTILQPLGVSSKQRYRYWIKHRSQPSRLFQFKTGERPGLNRMNQKIKRSLLASGLRAGDIVEYTQDLTERYIYDGTQFHFLSLWIRGRDIIPGLQVIEDFPVMHWSQYYDSVPLNWTPYREDLIKNFEFIRMQNQFHSQCLHRTEFTHWTGLRYVILILKTSSYAISREVFTKYVQSTDVVTCHLTTSRYAKFFKHVRHVPENPNHIMYLIDPTLSKD
jgi:hypothetical protein